MIHSAVNECFFSHMTMEGSISGFQIDGSIREDLGQFLLSPPRGSRAAAPLPLPPRRMLGHHVQIYVYFF